MSNDWSTYDNLKSGPRAKSYNDSPLCINLFSDDVGGEEVGREEAVGGIVVNETDGDNHETIDLVAPNEDNQQKTFSSSWKLNLILASICCWYAMSLTSWGSIASSGNVANPQAGDVSMWMIIASQWLMNALYFWTLLAPRLFSDRDFS